MGASAVNAAPIAYPLWSPGVGGAHVPHELGAQAPLPQLCRRVHVPVRKRGSVPGGRTSAP